MCHRMQSSAALQTQPCKHSPANTKSRGMGGRATHALTRTVFYLAAGAHTLAHFTSALGLAVGAAVSACCTLPAHLLHTHERQVNAVVPGETPRRTRVDGPGRAGSHRCGPLWAHAWHDRLYGRQPCVPGRCCLRRSVDGSRCVAADQSARSARRPSWRRKAFEV